MLIVSRLGVLAALLVTATGPPASAEQPAARVYRVGFLGNSTAARR